MITDDSIPHIKKNEFSSIKLILYLCQNTKIKIRLCDFLTHTTEK